MSHILDPGTAELDALLASMETQPEGLGEPLLIPVTPNVIRWLLRGTFVSDGREVRMIGGSLRGREFTPVFQSSGPPDADA